MISKIRLLSRARPSATLSVLGRPGSNSGAAFASSPFGANIRSLSSAPDNNEPKVEEKKKGGFLDRLFGVDSNISSPTFKNRWLMVAPAFATHMCIGSPYAWSMMADAITREHGFVTPAFSDWTLMEAALPLSIVFLLHGVSAAFLGKWQLKVGPRKTLAAGAAAFGGGLMLGAAGIAAHSLPLLYLGYGVLAGTGMGLSYTPPIQTLMQWFPDKKGLASGLTIAGFGSGALVFTPVIQSLLKHYAKLPEYLGPAKDFTTSIVDGRMFAEVNGKVVEVVSANATDLAKLSHKLSEGLYVVGSGSTGAAEALATVGAAYCGLMLLSSLTLRKPHPTYVPEGMPVAAGSPTPSAPSTANSAGIDLTVDEVMKTKQFYLLGTSFFAVASGGMALFSVAKPMMNEVFSATLPSIVTSAFAAKFILLVSAGSLAGRIVWAAVSDRIGRRPTFLIFSMGSIPLYLSLPSLVDGVVTTGSAAPLYGFIGSCIVAMSFVGGHYAILPAWESELFGASQVGATHGRMLLFSSASALVGPYALIKLRYLSEKQAVLDLVSKISPQSFQATFNASPESAIDLLNSKALSISKLMAIAPPGTVDPTPYLYDTTMYGLSGLMATAVVANLLTKPLTKPPTTINIDPKTVKTVKME